MKTIFKSAATAALMLLSIAWPNIASAQAGKVWSACHVDVNASMLAVTTSSAGAQVANIGAGAGCDRQFGDIVVGGGLRLDHGRGMTWLGGNVRAGYAINPYLLGYGTINYMADTKWEGALVSAGVGIETFAIGKDVTLFGEVVRDIAKFKEAREIDSATTFRFGVRYRFGGGVAN
jgi:hypothetical protein